MEDTGRIRAPLDWRAQQIVFGNRADQPIEEELRFQIDIDRAHVVMLAERHLLSAEVATRLLTATDRLVAQQYAPLLGRPAPRGVYLMYEHWLIETLGETAGGAAHLGRSRNDINATVLRLRLRASYARLLREGLRLLAVVIRTGERYARLTMPIYTHHQPALPITYGHYLTGVGLALLRDLRGIEDAARDLDRCPLGAGAAGGTTVPIDAGRTARLLGFRESVLHSVDAVASRDLVLRLLGAATILGVTLSRLAADLLLWSTAEFDLVRFPDALVGSSSMLPQKRNPFLLEHIQGRAGASLGAFTAAAMAMHATPFSNSVAVGTEAVKPVWQALDAAAEATLLARLVVAGAQPHSDRMRRRAGEGLTFATELANRLVREAGLSFRQAHREVGELVTLTTERGGGLESASAALFARRGLTAEPEWLDPSAIVVGAAYGGGPAAPAMERAIGELRIGWTDLARRRAEQSRRWSASKRCLEAAVAAVLAGHASPSSSSRRTVGCPWIVVPEPNRTASLSLVCVPHAGAGASAFAHWTRALPSGVELRVVQMPGRESRLTEPPITHWDELLDQIDAALLHATDRPMALFGHSLGALVAYELAHRFSCARQPRVVHLFVSGCRAPHLPSDQPRIHDLPVPEFVDALRRFKGTPPDVLDCPEMLETFVPTLRADFSLAETYVHRRATPLAVPISAYGGREDEHVGVPLLRAWRQHTTSTFQLGMFAGGHFFISDSRAALLSTVRAQLQGILAEMT